MDDPDERDARIWLMHLLFITERTGLSSKQVQRVFELSEEWWRTHPGVSQHFMED